MDDLEKSINESLNSNQSYLDLMFSKPKKLDFLDIEFDFNISPDHFIRWLGKEGEDITLKAMISSVELETT